MSDGDLSQAIKNASDNFLEGLSRLVDGFCQIKESISIVVDEHPVLTFPFIALFSTIIGKFGLDLLYNVYIYLFGAVVPISRDVRVEVYPVPVGFSLWVFTVAFVLFALLIYFRFVALRQRIEQLESS